MRAADPARATQVVFDSMPATLRQADWCDHSGLQLATLTTRPLVAIDPAAPARRHLGATEVTSSPDGTRHDFRVRGGARWADGTEVTARDYADALTRAADSRTVTGYWLRDVHTVRADGDLLRVTLHSPDHGFPALTALPALCPSRADGDGAGRYRITAATSRTVTLTRTEHTEDGSPRRLVVRRIKSPARNVAAFQRSTVDVTSDTAFPLHRVRELIGDPNFHTRRIGVVMALCFEGALLAPDATERRRAVLAAMHGGAIESVPPAPLLPIDRFLLPHDFDAAFVSAVRPESGPARRVRPPAGSPSYRLAYDTYYPNRLVARAVAAALGRAGIAVELVADSYENRGQVADLRLNLFRGLRADGLGIYRGLVFGEALRTHERLDDYLDLLHRHDRSPECAERISETARELDRILVDNALFVPIAEVPGLFLSRLGPVPWGWGE